MPSDYYDCEPTHIVSEITLSFYANLVSMQITLNAFFNHINSLCLPLNFQIVKNNYVPPECDFNRAIAVEW